MRKFYVGLLVITFCVFMFSGCEHDESGDSDYYNGDIDSRISISTQQNGFGYRTTGTVTLTFDPVPKNHFTVTARLNASSISGTGRAGGQRVVTISISGDTVATPYQSPSTLTITDPDDYGIHIREFQWKNH